MSLSKEETEEKIDEEAIKAEQIKRKQRKARLLKLRLAAVNVPDSFGRPERREIIQKSKNTKEFNQAAGENALDKQTQDRVEQEINFINKGTKIRPPKKPIDVKLRRKLAQEQKIAKEHAHSIVFRGHPKGVFRGASLEVQDKSYAKYFLLNAKQVNGNGWGISQHTARENMQKFIGRPLVITSSHWHGASTYGESYEHPYLPTNDLNQIFAHQEKFRVGNIVGIDEDKNGDFHAIVEMLPKFAGRRLPPFCSPAIFQLDAMEREGEISKWEALHLAALDSDPAYGARVAILKGTCVGTQHACTVQFKSAKQRTAGVFDNPDEFLGEFLVKPRKNLIDLISKGPLENPKRKGLLLQDDIKHKPITLFTTKRNKNSIIKKDQLRREKLLEDNSKLPGKGQFGDTPDTLLLERFNIKDHQYQPSPITMKQRIDRGQVTKINNKRKGTSLAKQAEITCPTKLKARLAGISSYGKPTKPMNITAFGKPKPFTKEEQEDLDKVTKPFNQRGFKEPDKMAKLKARLAGLSNNIREKQRDSPPTDYTDEELEALQNKKKLKKARSSVEDILRSQGRSVDASHTSSSWLSPSGDFIGGNEPHYQQIQKPEDKKHMFFPENGDEIITEFSKKHNLPRVQTFRMNRAGENKVSVGVHSPINQRQLKSIIDLEKGGRVIGFAVGPDHKTAVTGEGTRDLVKTLREQKLLS